MFWVKFASTMSLSPTSSARLKLQPTHDPATSANAQDFTTNDPWTFSISATFWNPLSAKTTTKGNPLTQSTTQVQLQIFAELVHFIYILASLRISMQGLNKWLIVVQVYAIAHIAKSLGFHISILLNSFFPHLFSSCNLYGCVNVCVHVLD